MITYRVVPYKGRWGVETLNNGEGIGLVQYDTKDQAERMLARLNEAAAARSNQ